MAHDSSSWLDIGIDSLDDLIDVRLGRPSRLPHMRSTPNSPDVQSPSARIRAFRAMKRAPPEDRERLRREMAENSGDGVPGRPSLKAVHLFSAEEVESLFSDVTEGLAFLVRACHYNRTGKMMCHCVAWQVDAASRYEAGERTIDMGRRRTDASTHFFLCRGNVNTVLDPVRCYRILVRLATGSTLLVRVLETLGRKWSIVHL